MHYAYAPIITCSKNSPLPNEEAEPLSKEEAVKINKTCNLCYGIITWDLYYKCK